MSNYDFKFPPVKNKTSRPKTVREAYDKEYWREASIIKALKFIFGVDKHIITIGNAYYTGRKKLLDFGNKYVNELDDEEIIQRLENLFREYKLNLLE